MLEFVEEAITYHASEVTIDESLGVFHHLAAYTGQVIMCFDMEDPLLYMSLYSVVPDIIRFSIRDFNLYLPSRDVYDLNNIIKGYCEDRNINILYYRG